ncbi:hypothetical protein D9M72_653240 [compost metagenome]
MCLTIASGTQAIAMKFPSRRSVFSWMAIRARTVARLHALAMKRRFASVGVNAEIRSSSLIFAFKRGS